MNYTLTAGQIRVDDGAVAHVIDHDDVHVFEIDLMSKYPGDIITWRGPGSQIGVDIHPGERTLEVDDKASGPTTFVLPLESMDWILVAEGSRYTVRVIAYRVER